MLNYNYSDEFKKILKKLFKKDKSTYQRLIKKIEDIISSSDIEHYKNLRFPMQDLKRVQMGEKVLVFEYNKKTKLISFENFQHHDKIY